MHRSWVERALAVLIAVWFVLVTIEPAALHSCRMHGTHGAAPAAAAAAGHHASSHDADAGAVDRHCSCLGDCAAGALAAPAERAHAPWPASVAAVSALPPLEAGFIPPAADFARPFANGPPSPVQG